MLSLRTAALGCAGLAIVCLPACGVQAETQLRSDLTTRLTTELAQRGFTNTVISNIAIRYEDKAEALVSVGGCRLRLDWTQGGGWKLHEGNIDKASGELTAAVIKVQPQFTECAKLPAPTAS